MNSIPDYWQTGIYGAALTTIKVGGPIQYLAMPRTTEALIETILASKEMGLPYKIIGGGSNLVIADDGYAGILIRPKLSTIEAKSQSDLVELQPQIEAYSSLPPQEARYSREVGKEYLSLSPAPQSSASGSGTVYVEAGAGAPWGQLVQWALTHNLLGLEYYARIPCYVGGAVFNNIHGEKHLLSELICAVKVYDPASDSILWLSQKDMKFGYDKSLLHESPHVLLSAVFALKEGSSKEVAKASDLYKEWSLAKGKVQPTLPSAGSVFQNRSQEEAGEQPVSAAWYIDKAGCKGLVHGGMQVYPGHANFIVNNGEGLQADFIALVRSIRQEVSRKYGVTLHPEVECIDSNGKRIV